MSITIYNQQFLKVHESKNLLAVLEHARRFLRPTGLSVVAFKTANRTILRVDYPNGDWCEVQFADAKVLADWIHNRIKHGRGKFYARGV